MSVRILWKRGGEATLLALDPASVRLWSSVPFPPGARAEGTTDEDPPATLKVKIHASREETKGDARGFLIEGRPLDLSKELRERLARSLS
jgi:hypothetical protein